MNKQRRHFDAGRKLEVVRMVKNHGLSIHQAGQTMCLGETAICRWIVQNKAVLASHPSIYRAARGGTIWNDWQSS